MTTMEAMTEATTNDGGRVAREGRRRKKRKKMNRKRWKKKINL